MKRTQRAGREYGSGLSGFAAQAKQTDAHWPQAKGLVRVGGRRPNRCQPLRMSLPNRSHSRRRVTSPTDCRKTAASPARGLWWCQCPRISQAFSPGRPDGGPTLQWGEVVKGHALPNLLLLLLKGDCLDHDRGGRNSVARCKVFLTKSVVHRRCDLLQGRERIQATRPFKTTFRSVWADAAGQKD